MAAKSHEVNKKKARKHHVAETVSRELHKSELIFHKEAVLRDNSAVQIRKNVNDSLLAFIPRRIIPKMYELLNLKFKKSFYFSLCFGRNK